MTVLHGFERGCDHRALELPIDVWSNEGVPSQLWQRASRRRYIQHPHAHAAIKVNEAHARGTHTCDCHPIVTGTQNILADTANGFDRSRFDLEVGPLRRSGEDESLLCISDLNNDFGPREGLGDVPSQMDGKRFAEADRPDGLVTG